MNFGNQIKFFNYRPLVSICLFAMAGIIFAVGLYFDQLYFFVLSIIVSVFLVATIIIKFKFAKTNKLFKILSVCFAFLISFALTNLVLDINNKPLNIEGDYYLRGRVYYSTSTTISGYRVVNLDNVKITSVKSDETKNIKGKVRLYLEATDGSAKELKLGELVRGKFSLTQSSLKRDGCVDFYSVNKNINIIGFGSEDDVVSLKEYNRTIFDKIKIKFKTVLDGFLSDDFSELGYAMIFGDRANLSEEIYEIYSLSGMSHLLAVSGLHVGFIVTLIGLVLTLFKAKDKTKFIVITTLTFLYALLCGFTVSVSRAFIMTVILLFSKLRKQRYDSLSSLALAALIILMLNPLYLFDIGFILSFSAVASIILFNRTFTNFFSRFLHNKLASTISVSLSASIGTTLAIMVNFNKLSIFAVITNCIVIPIASIAFMLMFVFVVLGALVYPLGIGVYLFEILMKIVTGIGKLTGAINLAGVNKYFMVVFGFGLILSGVTVSDYCIVKKKSKIILATSSAVISVVGLILMFICWFGFTLNI